jgi:hypothetical protein
MNLRVNLTSVFALLKVCGIALSLNLVTGASGLTR